MAGSGSAEVDHGGQILFLPKRDRADPSGSDGTHDASIEPRRSQLDGMARYNAGIEAVEPTGIRVVPGAVFDHPMITDAVSRRFVEGPVRNLVHADRA